MKTAIVLALACALIAIAYARPDEDKYTTKYDNFDVDKVLNNRRLLTNYCNCLLNKGKCTKEGEELKSHIGDALETECAKCSEKQKEVGKKVLKHLYEKEPELFKELEALYDKEGKYRQRYKEQAKKEGINL